MSSLTKKGHWLKEWFDEDGNVVSAENHPFDTFTEPSLIDGAKMRNLEGKLLTIIDATFQDKYQREAHKSLVRNEIWNWWYQYNSIPKMSNNKDELIEPTNPFK